MKKKLSEIAKTIRSKNAGSFFITMEIIFDNYATYEKVKNSGSVTAEAIANVYGIETSEIVNFIYFDPGMGVKANIRRKKPSGGPGETDIYGCQHYPPLLNMEVDL